LREGRGPLAGAAPDATFAEATARLAPGDLLLLYTDGVTEVCTDDLAVGERDLRAALARMRAAPPEKVVAAVERRALELRGTARHADIALVAVRAV
jgi:phosphoserine phosphatase RsbU/P